jgi:putative ABC transport system permease protein
VLYVNVRDRARELAALSATGWSGFALGRLVAFEGLVLGLAGGVFGAAAGLASVRVLTGTINPAALRVGGLAALAGVLLAGLFALVPALLLNRAPIAGPLADE